MCKIKFRSWSPTLVPIESPFVCDFLLVSRPTNWYHISHSFKVIAAYWSVCRVWQVVPLYLTASFGVNSSTLDCDYFDMKKTRNATVSCGAQHYVDMLNRFTSMTDGRTDGQNYDSNSVRWTTRAKRQCWQRCQEREDTNVREDSRASQCIQVCKWSRLRASNEYLDISVI